MIRRVCLFAGPGAGKSVIAAEIFIALKKKGHNSELVLEYIKKWAYQNLVPKSFDQFYILGKQMRSEDLCLSNGVQTIVTDSPLFLQVPYMLKYPAFDAGPVVKVLKEFDERYKPLNIFLDRSGINYQQTGRYEDYDQAVLMDNKILSFMKDIGIDYVTFPSVRSDEIVSFVCNELSI